MDGLLGPFCRRLVPEKRDLDLTNLLIFDTRSDDVIKPGVTLLKGGENNDFSSVWVSAGFDECCVGLIGETRSNFWWLTQSSFDLHRPTICTWVHMAAHQCMETIHL